MRSLTVLCDRIVASFKLHPLVTRSCLVLVATFSCRVLLAPVDIGLSSSSTFNLPMVLMKPSQNTVQREVLVSLEYLYHLLRKPLMGFLVCTVASRSNQRVYCSDRMGDFMGDDERDELERDVCARNRFCGHGVAPPSTQGIAAALTAFLYRVDARLRRSRGRSTIASNNCSTVTVRL